jgi:hypothetical protein
MLHVTCDHCQREIVAGIHDRYVVKMEVYAANDPTELTDAEFDEAHLDAVSRALSEAESELDGPGVYVPAYKDMRYDLCADCHQKFLSNPLGKDASRKLDFSEN